MDSDKSGQRTEPRPTYASIVCGSGGKNAPLTNTCWQRFQLEDEDEEIAVASKNSIATMEKVIHLLFKEL